MEKNLHSKNSEETARILHEVAERSAKLLG